MNPNAIIEGVVYRCKTSKGAFARKIACHIFRQFPDDPYDPYEIIWTYIYAPASTHVKNGRCFLNTFASKCVCSLPIELDNHEEAALRLKNWLCLGLNCRYYYQKPNVTYVRESDYFLVIPKRGYGYTTPTSIIGWEGKQIAYEQAR